MPVSLVAQKEGLSEIAVSRFTPVFPVVLLINCKVGDIHVVSLPGTLVICQVFPLDQVVVDPLLIHTGPGTEKRERFHYVCQRNI